MTSSTYADNSFNKNLSSYTLCRKEGENLVRTIRTIEVVDTETKEKKCQTIYTKKGKDEVIGSGRYPETCKNFLRNIEKNLKSANWQCKDVSQSSISWM